MRLLLLELNIIVGSSTTTSTKEIVISWRIPLCGLLRIMPHLLLMIAHFERHVKGMKTLTLLVVVGVSLDIRRLDKPRGTCFQSATIILLLSLHLLIQDVTVHMRGQRLLEILLLLILEPVVPKVLIVVCVIEEVPVTRVELERVTWLIVLSIAIVVGTAAVIVGRHIV